MFIFWYYYCWLFKNRHLNSVSIYWYYYCCLFKNRHLNKGTHSFVQLFIIHSFINSFAHFSFIHISFIHSFIYSFAIHLFIHQAFWQCRQWMHAASILALKRHVKLISQLAVWLTHIVNQPSFPRLNEYWTNA